MPKMRKSKIINKPEAETDRLIEKLSAAEKFNRDEKLPLQEIERAMRLVENHSHSLSAKRIRGSLTITNLKNRLVSDENRTEKLTAREREVINAKFFTSKGEITNSEAAEILGTNKQMIAYHLKAIEERLELNSAVKSKRHTGKPVKPGAADDRLFAAGKDLTNKNEVRSLDLLNDEKWQEMLSWRRSLKNKHRRSSSSGRDSEFLNDLIGRLEKIKSAQIKSMKTKPISSDGTPGRKRPPEKYLLLRRILLADKSLLELLTDRQREAMRIGLALTGKSLSAEESLGSKRFPESAGMTGQNFNYLIRQVEKRLK